MSLDSTLETFILSKVKAVSPEPVEFKIVTTILKKDGTVDSTNDNITPDGRADNNVIETAYQIVLDTGIATRCAEVNQDVKLSCNTSTPEQVTKTNILSNTAYKFAGSKDYNGGMKFYFTTDYTEINKLQGAQSLAKAQFLLTIAKYNIEFASASAYAFAVAEEEDKKEEVEFVKLGESDSTNGSHIKVEVKFAGRVLYTRTFKKNIEEKLLEVDKTKQVGQGEDGEDGLKYYVYGVPFTIRLGATGALGVKLVISYDEGISIGPTPYVSLAAFASIALGGTVAGVGAEIGVRANLNLLQVSVTPKFAYKATFKKEPPKNVNYWDCISAGGTWTQAYWWWESSTCSSIQNLEVTAGFYFGYEIELPYGNLEFYAMYSLADEKKKKENKAGESQTKDTYITALKGREWTFNIVEVKPFAQASKDLQDVLENDFLKKEWSKTIIVKK